MNNVFIEVFKAKIDTRRFRRNQKVWVVCNLANHIHIRFKWKGKGRYVSGIIRKFDSKYDNYSNVIGNDGIKKIEVSKEFAKRFGSI